MKKTRSQLTTPAIKMLFVACCLAAFFSYNTAAQIRPIYDQGALGLAQLLKRLNTDKRVLMIGAHPDDEDTALLAYLARGENARTAYLSLTRGDGGQNIIGPELGEALGVIRTEELLQARKLDGAEQYFTRAYDYGFSKTLAEAKEKWDEKVILCDVVHVIRKFKPQVVIAQFNGTASDGHGQHQFAGYLSPLAVNAAADSSQCRTEGPVWAVSKFYVRHRGQDQPTLRINTGKYDPLLGRSYFEIAMHARSQHRSQEQGVLELKGDQFSNLSLVESKVASDKDTSLFGGIAIGVRRPFEQKFDPENPARVVPELLAHHPDAVDTILRAAGIRIDILSDRETAAPFETVPVTARLFAPADAPEVKIIDIRFNLPHEKAVAPSTTAAPFRRETANYTEHFTLKVGEGTRPTQPYWLVMGRTGDQFRSSGTYLDAPFNDDEVSAYVTMLIADKRFTIKIPVEYRFADDIRGEIRRRVNIVPSLSIAPSRDLMIVSTAGKNSNRELSVSLTNNTSGPISGKARLNLPNGWTATPSQADFSLTRKGERATVRFTIDIPRTAAAGSFEIKAEAAANGKTYSESMQTIAYEHVQTHRMYRPAAVKVRLIDVRAATVKVGYIRGSGDRIPEAIKQLGIDVEEIDDAMLAGGDLSRFDTIVLGIRAYQVRPDVVANNQRLLDFASKGGTLIVQYQLPPTYSQQNLTPFPTQMGPRVSDENAPVTIVQPEHPVFNFPNKITADDFSVWVQERNLYNFSNMDPKYVGLLESHDAGEAENKGGLVVADIGKGKYVYCSYSLFRQLPAGVPGAYRLLANLISLPKAATTTK